MVMPFFLNIYKLNDIKTNNLIIFKKKLTQYVKYFLLDNILVG